MTHNRGDEICFVYIFYMCTTVLVNHVLISIFELGPKIPTIATTETFGGVLVVTSLFFWVLSHKIVNTVMVTTNTCHHRFGSDKREHIILIFGGIKLHIVVQFFLCFRMQKNSAM